MNRTPELFAALKREIATAPVAELPAIIGALAGLNAEAHLRMLTEAATAQRSGGPDRTGDDGLLTAQEVATRLHASVRYVRDHGDELGRVRLGRAVRFRIDGVERFLRRRTM